MVERAACDGVGTGFVRADTVRGCPPAAGYGCVMKALVINCTLKKSPEPSHTAALAQVVGDWRGWSTSAPSI
jgi:hypothetical protein